MILKIATCQFPVTTDIRKNGEYVLRQIRQASTKGAHVAHFPESALSGYAGVHLDTFEGFDWDMLEAKTTEIMRLASSLGIWVLLGSTHRLTGRHKPHNSVYVIDRRGQLVDRYDKMFCCGDISGRTADLRYYSPGSHFCTFTLKGMKCGVLICHDFRYDELYREYHRRGVKLMFHSYHNAGSDEETLNKYYRSGWKTIVPATMQAYAANNHMWISASNSSLRLSAWASFFVDPDGVIAGRLRSNTPGILLSTVDTGAHYYDACEYWRDRAMKGIYHSGKTVRDKRSDCRSEL
jgi:predicted amidohydrolase